MIKGYKMNTKIDLERMGRLLDDSNDIIPLEERTQEELIDLRDFNLKQIQEVNEKILTNGEDKQEFIKLVQDDIKEVERYLI